MLITNGTIITWEKPNRILEGQAILVRDGKIVEIGLEADLLQTHPGEDRLDAKGQYILPGNICAHTHFYGAYARGMGIPGSAPADFPEILNKLWWSLDKALDAEDVYYSAMVCIQDAIQHGTTTLVDHHASPNAIPGSLDVIARAVEETGIRASLCYEVTDRDGPEKARAGIDENVRFFNQVDRNDQGGMLSAMFGLHASLTLSEQTLEACRAAAPDRMGFHIHVAEHSVDEYDSLEKCGQRVIDRLERHGILGPHSIAVHAVHVDAREMEILAKTQTWVTHQPRSNMNNGVGLPQVEDLLRMGVRVGLGNDGFSNTMWAEWKSAYLAHKLWHLDPRWMNGGLVAEMAVYNNSALMSTLFGGRTIGKIEPGAQADLIFVDYQPYTPLTEGNLPWHILFGFHESMVTTTIVNGRVLMKDRKLLTIDPEKLARTVRAKVPQTWKRYQDLASNLPQ